MLMVLFLGAIFFKYSYYYYYGYVNFTGTKLFIIIYAITLHVSLLSLIDKAYAHQYLRAIS